MAYDTTFEYIDKSNSIFCTFKWYPVYVFEFIGTGVHGTVHVFFGEFSALSMNLDIWFCCRDRNFVRIRHRADDTTICLPETSN